MNSITAETDYSISRFGSPDKPRVVVFVKLSKSVFMVGGLIKQPVGVIASSSVPFLRRYVEIAMILKTAPMGLDTRCQNQHKYEGGLGKMRNMCVRRLISSFSSSSIFALFGCLCC